MKGEQIRGPFLHHPGDDDSSAVTFWGKQDLRTVLRKALERLDAHYARAPGTTEPREAVRWFAGHMEQKLRVNDAKGGWLNTPDFDVYDAMKRLHEELIELAAALDRNASAEVIAGEAADVANFAMFIADMARHAAKGR